VVERERITIKPRPSPLCSWSGRSGPSAAAPEERRPPLERQLRLLDAEIESNGFANLDSDVWRQSDPQGIGASRAGRVAQMRGRWLSFLLQASVLAWAIGG
jgi:hypothetical protein